MHKAFFIEIMKIFDAASIQDFVNDYLEGENVNDNFEDEHLDYLIIYANSYSYIYRYLKTLL